MLAVNYALEIQFLLIQDLDILDPFPSLLKLDDGEHS